MTSESLKDKSSLFEAPSSERGWFRREQERVRALGHLKMDWDLIEIPGEPLSVTIIRERRGDFDGE